jgi:hypothetical protein
LNYNFKLNLPVNNFTSWTSVAYGSTVGHWAGPYPAAAAPRPATAAGPRPRDPVTSHGGTASGTGRPGLRLTGRLPAREGGTQLAAS